MHPDKNPNDERAAQKFALLTLSYEFLLVESNRQEFVGRLRAQEHQKARIYSQDKAKRAAAEALDRREEAARLKKATKRTYTAEEKKHISPFWTEADKKRCRRNHEIRTDPDDFDDDLEREILTRSSAGKLRQEPVIVKPPPTLKVLQGPASLKEFLEYENKVLELLEKKVALLESP